MERLEILSKEEILEKGYNFDGDIICYSGEYDQQVCDSPTEEGGTPITGIVYELYENGNLNYYSYYVDGLLDGETVSFYEDGEIKSFNNMLKGTRHGKTIYWYENGDKKSESESKYGFDLYYKEWDKYGNLVKEEKEPSEFEKKMIEKYDMIEKKKQNAK